MNDTVTVELNDMDAPVDEQIYDCLSLTSPKSFFLYAGAGSGKTRSLVNALNHLRREHGRQLWLRGRRVGVITYTNAACDEIRSRLSFDKLIEVSTIHSFAWSLIGGYNSDIRKWLRQNLDEEIRELKALQARSRSSASQASVDRLRSIESKSRRIQSLDQIKTFTYSPTGDNRGRDSLNHSEVIGITVSFLREKAGFRNVLVGRFPVLLVDESQDTNRHLMDALLKVEALNEGRFCLGLFGDMMQRIYADGKPGLGDNLPPKWARPVKKMNHRSPHRVIRLINKIRSTVDDQQQTGRSDRPEGVVRLFVIPATTPDKRLTEERVAARMAAVTGNLKWVSGDGAVKALLLEHHMAARRMGFLDMFEALYPIERIRTGLLNGSLGGINLFSNQALPLVKAMQTGDKFAAAAVIRKHSPLLDKATLKAAGKEQVRFLRQAKEAADAMLALWDEGKSPRFSDVLNCVSRTGLFEVPESLRIIAARQASDTNDTQGPEADDADSDADDVMKAWTRFLETPFQQIEPYSQYVTGQARFDTHQGVKGREFARVMVIVDDDEARGFMFNYDKLFGVKEKSKTDIDHERKGEETSIDRTRRLFYVTCSRAMEELAIVAYSSNPEAVRASAIAEGWFDANEIELLTLSSADASQLPGAQA